MNMFYDFPTCCVAINVKCLTTSIAKAGATHFYSDLVDGIESHLIRDENGAIIEPIGEQAYKGIMPRTSELSKPTVLLMREPVDKFLSAMAMMGYDSVEKTLGDSEIMGNEYFLPQSRFKTDKIFKFPQQIEIFCSTVGLPYPLPVCNEGVNDKIKPTAKERKLIESYYADDIKLYNSLK